VSKVLALIAELCPGGVPRKALGDLGTIFGGLTGKTKFDFTDGNSRFVSYVNVYGNPATDLGADNYVRIEPGERQRALKRGDILFTGSSETPEDVAMTSVVTGEVDEPLYLNSFCIGFRSDDPELFDPDFAKHLFRSVEMRKQLRRTASGVTRFNVSKARLAKVEIPLLPTAVQREVAGILDSYQALERELALNLSDELAARRRQYAYHRESLITAAGSASEPVPMSDLGKFIRGRRFTKNDVVEAGIPAIHYGEIYTHYGTSASDVITNVRPELASQLRYAQPGDVVIAAVGETVEDVAKAVAWLGDVPVAIHDDTFLFRSELNPKYVSYVLQTSAFHSQKSKHVTRAKVKRLSGESLGKIAIPTPPLAEQERIVDILDRLQASVNDLTAALPAEREARRTQYEYCRDRLLTFEEVVA
jgi:type I restriction enzyme S subunit